LIPASQSAGRDFKMDGKEARVRTRELQPWQIRRLDQDSEKQLKPSAAMIGIL
jgi:hypothetical protein